VPAPQRTIDQAWTRNDNIPSPPYITHILHKKTRNAVEDIRTIWEAKKPRMGAPVAPASPTSVLPLTYFGWVSDPAAYTRKQPLEKKINKGKIRWEHVGNSSS